MATNINPILRLTLLVHLDWAIILGAVAPTAVAAVIGGTFIYQQKKQGKLDSARMVLEIDKEFRTDEFRKVHELIVSGKVDVTKDPHRVWLDRYLGYITLVYKFHKDGVIDEEHIKDFYDGYIPILYNNKCVREYIKKRRNENSYVFSHLWERLCCIMKTNDP